MDQHQVIQNVLEAYNGAVGGSYTVSRWPDRDNRGSADIDAYAESDGLQPLALEHTKIQSLSGQNRDSAWFMQGLGTLQTELSGRFPFCLDVVFPYENVQPGQNWDFIRNRIRTWLLDNALTLPEGRTKHSIPDVPFHVITSKRRSERHRVFLMRHEPPVI